MRTRHGYGRTGGFARLLRLWPVAAVVIAGLVVNASPGLQQLLETVIWASWGLLALLGLRAVAGRLPAPVRARVSVWVRGAGSAVTTSVLVQWRRLQSRRRGVERRRQLRPRRELEVRS